MTTNTVLPENKSDETNTGDHSAQRKPRRLSAVPKHVLIDIDHKDRRPAASRSMSIRGEAKESFLDELQAEEPFEDLHEKPKTGWREFLLLAVNTIGIIYGDIGTTYDIDPVMNQANGLDPGLPKYSNPVFEQRRQLQILAFTSLIIWLLILVPSIKYVVFILRADNKGQGTLLLGLTQGGTFAIASLIPSKLEDKRIKRKFREFLFYIAMIGAAFLIGDGITTPAISVLSAVEGIRTYAPSMRSWVVPLSCILLLFLFLVQRFGTEKIGLAFAPITSLWLLMLFGIGAYRISQFPESLKVLSPGYIFQYAQEAGFGVLFGSFNSALLAVTGVEALYADLGHFSAGPIRFSWLTVVFPSLVVQYIGQAAVILQDKQAAADPFYLTVPYSLQWPMVALATLATLIASQAVISGCFALLDQAISLNIFPRLVIIHTSATQRGQLYIPAINYFLMVCSIALVAIFQESEKLAAMYGLTVSGDMLITTVFYTLVIYFRWKVKLPYVFGYVAVFGTIDVLLFSSALLKIPHGGWITVLISISLFEVMYTWYSTARDMNMNVSLHAMSMFDVLDKAQHMPRNPGIGVFVGITDEDVPRPLTWIINKAHVLPEVVVSMTIVASQHPYVTNKIIMRPLGHGVYRMIGIYGFAEKTMTPQDAMQIAAEKNLLPGDGTDISSVSYMISRDYPRPSYRAFWYQKLRIYFFNLMLRLLDPPSLYFRLPDENTTEIGSRVVLYRR